MRLDMGVTEDKVKGWVKKFFDKLGAWSYAPVQHALGVHGIPDRVACVPVVITQAMVGKTIGIFVAVECKGAGRRGEKLAGHTGTQVTQLRDILSAQGIALSADSEDDIHYLDYALETMKFGGNYKVGLIERLRCRLTGEDK